MEKSRENVAIQGTSRYDRAMDERTDDVSVIGSPLKESNEESCGITEVILPVNIL